MERLAKFSRELEEAQSKDELRDLFSRWVKEIGYHGFDAFSLKAGTMDNPNQPSNFVMCDYGLDLIETYLRDGWMQMDPAMVKISQASMPFDFVAWLRRQKKNSSVLWQLAMLRLFDVHRAWLVPLCITGHTRGMTVYMRGNKAGSKEHFDATRDQLHLMCIRFIDRYAALYAEHWRSDRIGSPRSPDGVSVSPRELDCLHWAARGKTNWEIGQVLHVSENTVRFHLKNAFRKLGKTSRSAAIAKAMKIGLLKI